MIYLGIDWARESHRVVVLDEAGHRLLEASVEHSARGLSQLAQAVAELEPDPAQVRVGIELHNGSLLAWLVAQGYSVCPLNPKSAERARDRYRPSGAKDDAIDCFVLADAVRVDAGFLRPLQPEVASAEELLGWVRERRELVDERTAAMHRLRAILAEWCPELSALCDDFKRAWQRKLLAAFPLQHDLLGAQVADVEALCGKLRAGALARLQELLTAPCLLIPQSRRELLAWRVRELVQRIDHLSAQIKQIEQRLKQLCAEHPRAELLQSLPIKGLVSQASLLGALQAEGHLPWQELAPLTKQSGKSKQVRRRRACDHFMRHVMTFFAHNTSKLPDSWASDYYQQKRGAGKEHYTTLRCLAQRWVKVLCAMWRDHTPYNEDLHQQRRRAAA